MIPKKIQPYFKMIQNKKDGDNTFIKGILTCCDSNEFEVRAFGNIKYDMLSRMQLLPIEDKSVLDVCCKKCGRIISVYNSKQDGYDPIKTNLSQNTLTRPISCNKCNNNSFSVEIKYEYPDYQELIDLGITEIDNSFTWIWVALRCNQCGKRHSHFIDFETA